MGQVRRLGYKIYRDPNEEFTNTGFEKHPNNIANDSNGQEEKSRDTKFNAVKVSLLKAIQFDKFFSN